MSKQSLLKMFVIMVVITTFGMFWEETAIGTFLNIVLLISIILGFIALVFATSIQICTICLTLISNKKNEDWAAQLGAFNSLILIIGIFYLSFTVSTIVYQSWCQTFVKRETTSGHDDSFLFECCVLLPLLFLNKRIREDYRWTLLICGLILAGVCYGLYHSLDHLSAFGFGH